MNTPISSIGRALQATMQNLSPQQQQAYVAAPHGGISALQLIPLHQQLQQMQQALPKEVPPQRTVAQDLGAQMQAMAAPRAAGVAGLPVQNVGRPQNYAGGGIVAFDEGGPTSPFGRDIAEFGQAFLSPYGIGAAARGSEPTDLRRAALTAAVRRKYARNYFQAQTPEEYSRNREIMARLPTMSNEELAVLARDEGVSGPPTRARVTGAGATAGLPTQVPIPKTSSPTAGLAAVAPRQPSPAAAPTPAAAAIPTAPEMTRDEFLAQVEADAARSGLGKTAEARRKYLEGLQAAEKGRKGKDIAQALMKSGIGMMSAAARPGATFAQALAGGAAAGSEAMETLEAKREERAARLQEMQFALDEADELRRAGYIKEADAKKREADAIKRDLDKESRQAKRELDLEGVRQKGRMEIEGMQARRRKEEITAQTESSERIAGMGAAGRLEQAQAAARQRLATAANEAVLETPEYETLSLQLQGGKITPEQAQIQYDKLLRREVQRIQRAQQLVGGTGRIAELASQTEFLGFD